MVLLAGPGPEGGGAGCVSPQPPSAPQGAQVEEDPDEYEEYDDFSSLPDTRSIASDDSFYPFGDEEEYGAQSAESAPEGVPEAATLLRAACANDVGLLRALVQRGPRVEEVQETDRNGRTGLIVACYHGFVDTVVALAECPHVDVNWQDSEGNTALITAAQAGHATITNYLLSYFPGLDLERRNVFGFTALMKAAMQGRTDCVRALMLAGADVHARDPRRGMSSQEWATYTGRVEAVRLMQRLLERPCPEQFGEKYKPELPLPPETAVKPAGSKNCLQRLTEFVRSALTSRSSQGLEDGGVLDHMVRMTTSLYSPAVAIVCQTLCPESPPCVGKRRLAVQEILAARAEQDTRAPERGKAEGREREFRTSPGGAASSAGVPGASLPPAPQPGARGAAPASRKASLLPLQLLRRSSVRPGVVVPRVRITKAPAPTFQPERPARKASTKDSAHLQIPKWRYKEAKEEKRKAEEAEKKRLAEAQKERRASRWRKRT
ncbi:ankyrin repeat domain-containing protein 33B [Microcebus murinus]|uniref:ankyrin repeat domain-containing protein 33B n=1 Tax=Microcebus murinus TaxID=30608 RepID=UPI003F6BB2D1